MGNGSTNAEVNMKAIWELTKKIRQTEIIRWQYISTDNNNMQFYIVDKNTFCRAYKPTCLEKIKKK